MSARDEWLELNPHRQLPDFLIVGTMKSGTSSLATLLDRTPGVFVPKHELHFFNREARFEQGLTWYAECFDDAAIGDVCGEKTPTYSYAEHVPRRIHHFDPSIKLVWIFRHPIDRAYSHYWYGVGRGRQSATFAEAIHAELAGTPTDPWQRYIHRGRYDEQIERFVETGFPLDQMLFLRFDDLTREPAGVIEQTRRFVDAGELPPGTEVRPVWRNRSKSTESSSAPPPMPEEIRRLMEVELAESVERLRELTGIDFTGH